MDFFFFSITEHADVKKQLKPRALCIDNIYVNVRLIKTLLWLFWSLLEFMQINWSLWKVADAMFEVPEDQKKKKKKNWPVATEKITVWSVLFKLLLISLF